MAIDLSKGKEKSDLKIKINESIHLQNTYFLASFNDGNDMYRCTIVWLTALNDVQYVKPPIVTLQNVCRSYIDGFMLNK